MTGAVAESPSSSCRCREPQRLERDGRDCGRAELGVSDKAIRKAIAGFGGVKRRFTRPASRTESR